MEYVIGVDLGTSSLKSVLYDQRGNVHASSNYSYPLIISQVGYSEQNPQEWIDGLRHTILEILDDVPDARSKTKGLAIAGQMHSLVLLDDNDEVIRNAILWNDVRTSKECKQIEQEIDVVSITKNKALEGFTLPKLLWIKNNEPSNWDLIDTYLLPKDFLVHHLTNEKVMDYSDAAGTLLLDFEKNKWSNEIFDKFGIAKEWAPELKWSSELVGTILPEIAKTLGFQSEVKIFAGAADNASAALASGIIDENTALASIGTSGVFLSYEEENTKNYDGQIHYFNHSIKHSYYSMGVTLAAGKSLEWFKDLIDKNMNYEELLEGIGDIPIGSSNLLFTPYIMGERTPYTDANIRGSFIGLDAMHTRDHMARAVLEGITFSLNDSKKIMDRLGKDITNIISVGGGAKNNEWLQIQADIFNVPVTTLSDEGGPAQGAAMIASLGLSWFENVEECVEEFVTYDNVVRPIKENVELYKEYYTIYKKIYKTTRLICKELSLL